jgi:dolichol-phosphate mannosyltransferase/undecaprenyl-phosphate 4-deoxy-4-formamido-L-arabinose transferase
MEGIEKPFEIVLVDDGSIDRSWLMIEELVKYDHRILGIQLMRNYGQANATMCGLRCAKGEFIITIDDDLQNPPEEIPLLIESIENDPQLDVLYGTPIEKRHALWRRLGSNLLNWISSRIFTRGESIKLTSFRIMRRNVVDHLLTIETPHPAPGALLFTITPRIKNVTVRHEPRTVGKSGYTFSKIYRLTLSKFLSFSTLPLRFLAISGVFGIFISFILGVGYFIKYLLGGIKMPGFMTLVLLLIASSGFNFLAFGIVGEYLIRILQAVYGTPQYQIRHSIGTGEPVSKQNR